MTNDNEATEDKKTAGREASVVERIVMCGVDEYSENMEVYLCTTDGFYKHGVPEKSRKGYGHEVIHARNEGGYNSTNVDLDQLLEWIAKNRPSQYAKFITKEMTHEHT